MRKIRVLIVDDSASVRQTLASILTDGPEIEVIGTASDPFVAARRIRQEVPDVILLDVEMPRMDGITFLRKIMSQKPIPVVMCSSLLESGSDTLLEALESGAVDIVLKPRVDVSHQLTEAAVRIRDVIKAASQAGSHVTARWRATTARGPSPASAKLTADAVLPPPGRTRVRQVTQDVVCIGASTGGTEALREVLEPLPENGPGIVIVQHMPERFTAAFARRLNQLCQVEVKEAESGDAVLSGRALIAPGNRHMLLRRQGAGYRVELADGPLVARHRPSVDVLFRSAAQAAGPNAVGVLMTGMGDDGARGLLEMRQAGARTIAQDEVSCVVFGMPREAIALGAAERIVPLRQISAAILRMGNR